MLRARVVAQGGAIGLQKANVAIDAGKQGLSMHPFRSTGKGSLSSLSLWLLLPIPGQARSE